MSFKPILYMQTDKRWSGVSYAVNGERTTIGGSGCGPTAAAMVVAEWADASETPLKACEWSLKNGYKAYKQGTYYSFFKPYFARFGLNCQQLNYTSLYNNAGAAAHLTAYNAVKGGNYVIACMGKGNWTSSGHFVLWYGIQGDNVLINDPASTAAKRINASWNLFKSQVKYYFVIDSPANLKAGATENYTVTDIDGFLNERAGAGTSYEVTGQLLVGSVIAVERVENRWVRYIRDGRRRYACLTGLTKGGISMAKFADTEGHWAEEIIDELAAMGIVHGDGTGDFRPDEPVTRAEAAAMVRNAVKYVTGK